MRIRLKTILRGLSFAASLLLLALSGCGTTEGTEKAQSDEDHVSTIPWNKPQKWENKSVLGAGGPGVGY